MYSSTYKNKPLEKKLG